MTIKSLYNAHYFRELIRNIVNPLKWYAFLTFLNAHNRRVMLYLMKNFLPIQKIPVQALISSRWGMVTFRKPICLYGVIPNVFAITAEGCLYILPHYFSYRYTIKLLFINPYAHNDIAFAWAPYLHTTHSYAGSVTLMIFHL